MERNIDNFWVDEFNNTFLLKEERPCKDCKNMSKLWDGWSYCDKLMMKVIPDMNVAYRKDKGTCFEAKE